VVKHIATRIAVMYLGRIVEIGTKEALFAAPRHPYTQALLSAIALPEPGMQRERALLAGDVPSPMNPPSGCHFHPRCVHARELCSQRSPVLEEHGGHSVACHFWREIAAPHAWPEAAAITPARRRLERLQSAFAAAPIDPVTDSHTQEASR
jgi:oligopeptide/dipeptide ABC transporter ATP-binding protein